jgi:transmembrane sensor
VEPVVSETRHTNADAAPRRIMLADGTVVTLNTNTEVETRFSASERRVALTSGEAHFDVAHETARPFNVTANGMSIRAVGTAFNVRVAAASVEVVVTSGKVQLIQPESAVLSKNAAPREVPLLEPGDRAVVAEAAAEARREVAITRLEPAQLREALAWQQEMLVFENTPLREVVAQFNLRNSLQLRLADAEFGERRINGVFAANNVAAFVNLFERGGDVLVERNGDREIVLRKAR